MLQEVVVNGGGPAALRADHEEVGAAPQPRCDHPVPAQYMLGGFPRRPVRGTDGWLPHYFSSTYAHAAFRCDWTGCSPGRIGRSRAADNPASCRRLLVAYKTAE